MTILEIVAPMIFATGMAFAFFATVTTIIECATTVRRLMNERI